MDEQPSLKRPKIEEDSLLRVTAIAGPMFAGKTSELIKRYEKCARDKAIYSPDQDSRSGGKKVATHDGHAVESKTFKSISQITDDVRLSPDIRHVFVEEIHLWQDTPLIKALAQTLAKRQAGVRLVAPIRRHIRRHSQIKIAFECI